MAKNPKDGAVVSRREKGPSTMRSLLILLRYHDRLIEGIGQDLKLRYTGSVFGIAWAFIFPLVQLSIYAMLYVVIFRVRPSGLTEWDYVLLVFSGLVPLFAFNEMLTTGLGSLTANKALLMSTVFPAELIPVRAALTGMIPMLLGLGLTLCLSVVLQRSDWEAIIIVPIAWILLVMFAVGLSWMLSLLSLVAKDIQHGIGLVLMLAVFLSPFAYTPEMVPQSLKIILYLNPMSYFVLTFQAPIAYGEFPQLIHLGGAALLGIGTFLLGFVAFTRSKGVFFDYV